MVINFDLPGGNAPSIFSNTKKVYCEVALSIQFYARILFEVYVVWVKKLICFALPCSAFAALVLSCGRA
jgi:hypothetical protein